MKTKKTNFKILITTLLLLFVVAACGTSGGENSVGPASRTGGAFSETGGPGIGNLPPPNSAKQESSRDPELSSLFVNFNSEMWNSYSGEYQGLLKPAISRLVSESRKIPSNEQIASTSPNFISNLDPSIFYTFGFASCDPVVSFICLKTPNPDNGTDTTSAVNGQFFVEGTIDYCQVRRNMASDPVISITPAKQGGSAEMSTDIARGEITFVEGDERCMNMPKKAIYSFKKSVSLKSGEGLYNISIGSNKGGSWYEVRNSKSEYPQVIWQGPPQIQLVSLMPPEAGNFYPDPSKKKDPIPIRGITETAPKVSMSSVIAKIKLLSNGTNFSLKIENFDETATTRRYVTYGGGGQFKLDGANYVSNVDLKLLPGKNRFKITASHPDFKDREQVLPEFVIENVDPTIGIKLLKPTETEKLIEPRICKEFPDPKVPGKTITKCAQRAIDIVFCLTNLSEDLEGFPKRPVDGNKCITSWPIDKPAIQLKFNGIEVSTKEAGGVYSAQVQQEGPFDPPKAPCHIDPPNEEICPTPKPIPPSPTPLPMLGNNLIQITATPPNGFAGKNEFSSVFAYGYVNKMVNNNGILEQEFLERGVSVEIGKKIIREDLRRMLSNYLNSPDFRQQFIDIFASNGDPTGASCRVSSGDIVTDDGKLKIETQPDFNYQKIEINSLEVAYRPSPFPGFPDVGQLYAGLTVRDLYGRLNIYTGPDRSIDVYRNVRLNIKELTIQLSGRFEKDPVSGLDQLIIEKQVDDMGNPLTPILVTPNLDRDPLGGSIIPAPEDSLAAATVQRKFMNALEANFFCFLPPKMNDPVTGLAKWRPDLRRVADYSDENSFRTSLSGKILGKEVSFDIAYDLLKGGITFFNNGIQLQNLPLRFSAGGKLLKDLFAQQMNGKLPPNFLTSIGSLSQAQVVPAPSVPLLGRVFNFPHPEEYNLGVKISEDVINQALFAASMSGLLDIDLEPNFFTDNKIGFIPKFLPTASSIFGSEAFIDLNQDGFDNDRNAPVRLSIRPDLAFPPTVHFLDQNEVKALVEHSKKVGNTLNPNLKYFRISLANLGLTVYPVSFNPDTDYAAFCKSKDNDPKYTRVTPAQVDSLDASKPKENACSQSVSFFYKKKGSCPEGFEGVDNVPIHNGPVTSTEPIASIKASLVLYGVIEGSYRESLFSNKYYTDYTCKKPKMDGSCEGEEYYEPTSCKKGDCSDPDPSSFVRIRLLPTLFGDEVYANDVKLVTNNTAHADPKKLVDNLKVIFSGALADNCQNFNEIQIEIPEVLPNQAEPVGDIDKKLQDYLEVDYFKWKDFRDGGGNIQPLLPQLRMDEDPMYLDLLGSICTYFKDGGASPICTVN